MGIKEHNKDTEQKILKYAEEEFLSKGYAGARTTSIAEAAGVTHAMLHYYFRTKDKLFERILQEKTTKLHDMLIESVTVQDENAQIEDVVREIISSHLDFLCQNPELPGFLIGEMQRNPQFSKFVEDNLKSFSVQLFAKLGKLIDKGVQEGKLNPINEETIMLDIISLNIFAFMARPLVNAILGGCMNDIEEFVESRKKENFDTIMCKLRKQ
ncbi:MAG: TetR/AcrR family transcriptional regulator [Muribaculaceae bacterium]|nr:TetR/AcrR family transcriptional regulator [Muribaculaceae bacterium]